MTKDRSIKIIKELQNYYGQPKIELRFKNIYELVISVVLSAQTTDKQVNSVSGELFNRYPDLKSLADADLSDVEDIIRSIGLYKSKARYIVNLSKEVINNHKGEIPDNFKELIKLTGIGRKSANVILSVGFGCSAFAVDTHVHRVANRIGYINSNNRYDVEMAMTTILPEKDWVKVHQLFISHGRELCKARNPSCFDCPIRLYCDEGNNIL